MNRCSRGVGEEVTKIEGGMGAEGKHIISVATRDLCQVYLLRMIFEVLQLFVVKDAEIVTHNRLNLLCCFIKCYAQFLEAGQCMSSVFLWCKYPCVLCQLAWYWQITVTGEFELPQ